MRDTQVRDAVTMPLASVAGDDVLSCLQDPQQVAAFAVRKLQSLHLSAQPGFSTKADVPLSLIDSVLRALVEAPSWRLTHELASTDWDHEQQLLDAGLVWKKPPPADELPRFEHLVDQLGVARTVLINLIKSGNPVLI